MPSISCIKKEEVPVLRYIIINADDFGRHAEINRAVEEGLVHGCLRSATVMPGGAAFAGAIDIARRHEELGLGVHFTLVDGHPILPPEESSDFCHRMVLFGRDVCTARSPKCENCPLRADCAAAKAEK